MIDFNVEPNSPIEGETPKTARTVAPAPVLLSPPARITNSDVWMPLTPRIIWELVTTFVLTQTETAAYEIELLDYELLYLAPRAVAWHHADCAASARGELDAFNPESLGDEDDRNETINRFHDAHAERAGHAATLARLGFWRRCALWGVPRDEIMPRAGELWALAHEVCADRPAWQWCAMDVQDLINVMRPDADESAAVPEIPLEKPWSGSLYFGKGEPTHAPTYAGHWACEFSNWVREKGLRADDFPTLQRVTTANRAEWQKRLDEAPETMPPVMLTAVMNGKDSRIGYFLCNNPRDFLKCDATHQHFLDFLAHPVRGDVWADWLVAEQLKKEAKQGVELGEVGALWRAMVQWDNATE